MPVRTSSGRGDEDDGENGAESEGLHGEEIDGPDVRGVVLEEGPPRLGFEQPTRPLSLGLVQLLALFRRAAGSPQ